MQAAESLPPEGGIENARTLWVGQLPAEVTEASLLDAFAHEQLVSVHIAKDTRSSASLGYGFLTFATRQAAQSFLLSFSGRSLAGLMPLKLRWASPDPDRQLPTIPAAESEVPDSHSLFVGDLPPEVSDTQLQQHFQQYFPTATSAKVITDRLSGQSKGYGFVRFTNAEERDRALSVMNGQKFGQQTIRVNRAKAKKYQGDGLYYPSDYDANNTTVFVGNVNTDITEEDLYTVFKRCGEILSVKLLKAKGCSFITFGTRDAAERAINYLHGKVIKNSAVRLCWGRRSMYNSYPLPLLAAAQQHTMLQQIQHPAVQGYTAQLAPPAAYAGQGYAPHQHYAAGTLHSAPAYNSPLAYQGQPYWRPEMSQDLQSQSFSPQSGRALPSQAYMAQNTPNYALGQSLSRQTPQFPYLSGNMSAPASIQNLASGQPIEGLTQYGVPSMSYPQMATRPATRPPGGRLLTEAEEVLARLSLNSGPSRPSF